MSFRSRFFAVTLAISALGPGFDRAGEPATEGAAVRVALVAEAAAAEKADVTVHVTRDSNGYRVEGHCRSRASRPAAWSVLTDYDGIDGFVSSMRESRVTERVEGGHLLVEQVAVGRLFLFSRSMRVVLLVHEEPPGVIRFEDVLLRDFRYYKGEWRIEERGEQTEIFYQVSARPAFSVPDVIARGMFARTVRNLLSEVEAEMGRRAAAALAAKRPAPLSAP